MLLTVGGNQQVGHLSSLPHGVSITAQAEGLQSACELWGQEASLTCSAIPAGSSLRRSPIKI